MTPEEKAKIRLEIEDRITQTKKMLASLKEQTKPIAPDNALGRLTRMEAIHQKSISEANLRSSEEALIRLEEALDKLDDEGFAICVKCQKMIPIERILAIPQTRLCVPCASQL